MEIRDGKLIISKVQSTQRPSFVKIEVRKENSKPAFVIEMEMLEFAQCLLGTGFMPCEYMNFEM